MEKVNFKIELEGHGWDNKWPNAVIKINDTIYINTLVPRGTNFYEFDVELPNDWHDANEKHILSVAYTNKNFRHDIILDNEGSIVKSKFLVVKNISIEDIELTHDIIYNLTSFTVSEDWYLKQNTKDPKTYPLIIKNELTLSWNGVWELPFETPLYLWMLENI